MPEAAGETAEHRNFEHRRAVRCVFNSPKSRFHMGGDGRSNISRFECAQIYIDWNNPSQRISELWARQAQDRISVALIRYLGSAADFHLERCSEFIATLFLRAEPGFRTSAGKGHAARRCTVRPMWQNNTEALADALSQSRDLAAADDNGRNSQSVAFVRDNAASRTG
jgi:hypothetical protein